eukprot:CAMPEP_0175977562 /NCGR_PEP_ID=MMETSP0108-20121206/45148_1 /TAXON_ID=195067 ORGANISM="Goniomonas pacifica, Strain CCMP1869" /NCGR_SAMPLE_ID=MMETSP0108 /ASSEMBLY_ACC=CAM_ASM_000204 /LENGTH=54 /DNA_ID=CAMNT_0017307593 /DNA_START=110 /DNA_END=274 /DNA_ORIENTATION=+
MPGMRAGSGADALRVVDALAPSRDTVCLGADTSALLGGRPGRSIATICGGGARG